LLGKTGKATVARQVTTIGFMQFSENALAAKGYPLFEQRPAALPERLCVA
jgi:hypothetical protein